MKNRGLIFILGIVLLVGIVSAENNAKVEWDVMNLSDDGNVTNYSRINHSTPGNPEIKVIAQMASTEWWAEVELNTSEIDFGQVEKGKKHIQKYTIKARGSVDIEVKPELKSSGDIFSGYLFMGRTQTGMKKIEDYSIRYNLTQNLRNWSAIGTNDKFGHHNGSNKGEQTLNLDLRKFKGVIPFDQPMENIIVFKIIPIWSSVEPINNAYSPDEDDP